MRWSFSGLNWPMDKMTGLFVFLFGDLSGILVKLSVLQGGKTLRGRIYAALLCHQYFHQKMSCTCPRVQLEFVMQTWAKLPTHP
mmetsp:Transcript_13036/g.36574  ORF Transcript_13036/g.36574 Transcript_13036/m.36574 type:complete len:84 (+) Transcript_13036:652-903(+)